MEAAAVQRQPLLLERADLIQPPEARVNGIDGLQTDDRDLETLSELEILEFVQRAAVDHLLSGQDQIVRAHLDIHGIRDDVAQGEVVIRVAAAGGVLVIQCSGVQDGAWSRSRSLVRQVAVGQLPQLDAVVIVIVLREQAEAAVDVGFVCCDQSRGPEIIAADQVHRDAGDPDRCGVRPGRLVDHQA